MEADELKRQWKRHNDRPAWILEHREELAEYVNTSDPIPDDGMFAVRQWLKSYKGTVTHQLNEAVGEGDSTSEGGKPDSDAHSGETGGVE